MNKLIIASNNKGKIAEIKDLLKDIDIEVFSLKEMGIEIDVEEDGNTFEENAKKKAVEIADYLKSKGETDFIVMSDDSGLEVDYLNGEPGVYSARYAGEHGNDKKNNEKLLQELKGVQGEKRSARFVCQLALVNDLGVYKTVRGEVEGTIIEEIRGEGGFGYDPLFFNNILNKTFAEATKEEKGRISHRGNALKKMKEIIKELI